MFTYVAMDMCYPRNNYSLENDKKFSPVKPHYGIQLYVCGKFVIY